MEVRITTKEMVKPSSQEVYVRKPFSLSLLDQLVPASYVPLVLFYNKPKDSDFSTVQILVRLRQSLSKALDQFYPLSGRTIDNLYIESYDKGVPYVEARIKGCLADRIAKTELEWLNQLLPCQSFSNVPISTSPQIAIQVNIFDCGGIAIALCGSHKVVDGTTMSAFLKSWAAFNRGYDGEILDHGLLDAGSRLFSPLHSIPRNYLSSIESLWFQEGWHRTRRFVFDDYAMATLKYKANTTRLEHPTRAVALTAFLWKYAMLASRAASGRSKPSVLSEVVDLRPRMKPRLPEHAIGNLTCTAVSTYNSTGNNIELENLAYLVREGMDTLEDQISLLQTGDVLRFKTDQHNRVANMAAKGDVEFFYCSSWLNTLDRNEADFGWGRPTWSSPGSSESRYYSFVNGFVLKTIDKGKAIEAVITLDAKAMDILEHHSDFLAFASSASNPYPMQSRI